MMNLPFSKSGLLACASLIVILPSTPAHAQVDPVDVQASVEVVSDYRFRGISRSNGKVALQGVLHADHQSGLYAGVMGSTIENLPRTGGVEADIYGGYRQQIASGTDVNMELHYFWYPDGEGAAGPSDYFEAVSEISHTLGPIEAKASAAYSWDQAALGGDSLHLGAGLSAGIPNTPVVVRANVGRTYGAIPMLGIEENYWNWSLWANAVLDRVTLGIGYVDTDLPKIGIQQIDKKFNKGLVFSLSSSF